jgi:serine protease AprX
MKTGDFLDRLGACSRFSSTFLVERLSFVPVTKLRVTLQGDAVEGSVLNSVLKMLDWPRKLGRRGSPPCVRVSSRIEARRGPVCVPGWRGRLIALALMVSCVAVPGYARTFPKLDPVLPARALLATGESKVVVTAKDQAAMDAVASLIQQLGGTLKRRLSITNGQSATVPNSSLLALAGSELVQHVAHDRLIVGAMERTGVSVGATRVREELGLDGSGVGIAVIDSGVAPAADDLSDHSVTGAQRIDRFVDFVHGREAPYDDYGHGTHVAGIIAGNGFDSSGARSGLAPGSRLVVLKALDRFGRGRISDVIAALDYAVEHRSDLNIRAINLSVAAGVYESYDVDPLTIATKRAVDAGMVVVAAAGNAGQDAQGRRQYGAIAAPGNAPWVVTVGASSHMGTVDRADDTIAAFSSRGPTAVDRGAKPDLVAPGVGIESLSAPHSLLYKSMSAYLLSGTVPTPYLPYLSLSGTSMAAPVVTGTVALMLQANPSLTPNAVKAILEYTAQVYPGYDALTEGAGFLNARGAVELARFFATPTDVPYPATEGWSGHIIWGNHRVRGGWLTPDASAWSSSALWGDAITPAGTDVAWGLICIGGCDTSEAVWAPWRTGTYEADTGTLPAGEWDNVVWGAACNGANCPSETTWSTSEGDSVVWGSTGGDSVVWGSTGDDTVVWDSSNTVVWGSGCTDTSCQVVWNQQ